MKEEVRDYHLIITEIDAKNERSLNAHNKKMKTYVSNNQEWMLVSLNI